MGATPCVRLIKTDDVANLVDRLARSGVDVEPVDDPGRKLPADMVYRCSIARSSTRFWIDHDMKDATESFVLIPYPPYQMAFWRWSQDSRLYDQIIDAVEEFEVDLRRSQETE